MSKNTYYMDILVAAKRGEVVVVGGWVKCAAHALLWTVRKLVHGNNRTVIETDWHSGELGADGKSRPYWAVNVYAETWTWSRGIHKLKVGAGFIFGDRCEFELTGRDCKLTITPPGGPDVFYLAADPESGCEVADVFLGLATLANATAATSLPVTQTDLREVE